MGEECCKNKKNQDQTAQLEVNMKTVVLIQSMHEGFYCIPKSFKVLPMVPL